MFNEDFVVSPGGCLVLEASNPHLTASQPLDLSSVFVRLACTAKYTCLKCVVLQETLHLMSAKHEADRKLTRLEYDHLQTDMSETSAARATF